MRGSNKFVYQIGIRGEDKRKENYDLQKDEIWAISWMKLKWT